jgi:hypothetical protein
MYMTDKFSLWVQVLSTPVVIFCCRGNATTCNELWRAASGCECMSRWAHTSLRPETRQPLERPDTLTHYISRAHEEKMNQTLGITGLSPGSRSRPLSICKSLGLLRFIVLAIVGLLTSAAAQQSAAPPAQQQPEAGQQAQSASPSAPPQSSSTDKSPENPQVKKQEKAGTSNDRLFFALPNFLTVESKDVPPLTAGQKFKVVARGAFDPIQIPWYAIQAGISQAANSEPGYGQGAEGYGKRFGAYAADGVIENFMVGAIFPSLLRQDPRYFEMGQGRFWHRAGYAMTRVFITRSDSGHKQFNFSEILGSATGATISTYSYHPRDDRNVPNTISVWGTQVGYDSLTAVIKEFWPDIRRRFAKKEKPSAP